jgi:hypothetical protein
VIITERRLKPENSSREAGKKRWKYYSQNEKDHTEKRLGKSQ